MKRLLCAALAGVWMMVAPAYASHESGAPQPVSAMNKPRPTHAIGAALDTQGRVWMARVDAGQIYVSRADAPGQPFDAERPVLPAPETINADGENRPLLRVANDGTLLLVWAQSVPVKRFAGNVRFARSVDGGKTWSAPLTLNDDGRITSHSYPAIALNGRGLVTVAWLDGRDREVAGGKEGGFKGSSLYMADSTDNGRSFVGNRAVAHHTCECCRTALAWTRRGAAAFWRHQFDTNTRDFAFAFPGRFGAVRATDDDWKVDGCPHHGGGLATDADNRLHYVWFTSGEKRQGLFYAHRSDDTASAPLAFGNPDAQPGHPDVAAHGKTVLVTWREFDGKHYSAWAMRSDDGGARFGAPVKLGNTAGVADYPLPLVGAGRTLVVWRTLDEGVRVLPVDAGVNTAALQ